MSDTPQWFWDAVETPSESGTVEVNECDIHYQAWSQDGPGLLLVHGHNAHAHWWDFIAPSFMQDFSTVALDLSGMGDSDHRDNYSNDNYAAEILAVMEANKLGADTTIVAHSFGGMMAIRAVALQPTHFKQLVLVDSGVRHPEDAEERGPSVERWTKPKIYPSKEVALSRFRLQPPQTCANQYLVDHIARHSVEFDDEGWVWKFDEELNTRMSMAGNLEDDFKAINIPCTLIYGADSESFKPRSAEYMQTLKPDLKVIAMENAQHHLFLDQPEAFIAHLKSCLAEP